MYRLCPEGGEGQRSKGELLLPEDRKALKRRGSFNPVRKRLTD